MFYDCLFWDNISDIVMLLCPVLIFAMVKDLNISYYFIFPYLDIYTPIFMDHKIAWKCYTCIVLHVCESRIVIVGNDLQMGHLFSPNFVIVENDLQILHLLSASLDKIIFLGIIEFVFVFMQNDQGHCDLSTEECCLFCLWST